MLMDSGECMACILQNHVLYVCILSNKITRCKALFVLVTRKNNNINDNKTTDYRRLNNRKNLDQNKDWLKRVQRIKEIKRFCMEETAPGKS